jgi:hypothetical protein
MADINMQRGHDAPRILTILDRNGDPIDITGGAIVVRYKLADGTGTTQSGTATVSDGPAGEASYTFPASHFQTENAAYDVRVRVTPAPNGTDGDFPEGAPLSLFVWQGF